MFFIFYAPPEMKVWMSLLWHSPEIYVLELVSSSVILHNRIKVEWLLYPELQLLQNHTIDSTQAQLPAQKLWPVENNPVALHVATK